MKNLFILPTDKPSRLYKQTKVLLLDIISDISKDGISINQHIYITNDEEIKDGEYQLYNPLGNFDNAKVSKAERLLQNDGRRKKIILTTDQDLIKDGVQAIDDEFLEWFVKNPSCESVKTLWTIPAYKIEKEYRIEFPQEERKIDTCYNFDKEIGCVQVDCRCEKEEPKEETLEEVMNENGYHDQTNDTLWREGVLFGAKWQQQQDKNKYSEEDMTNYTIYVLNNNVITPKQWFNKFKKK